MKRVIILIMAFAICYTSAHCQGDDETQTIYKQPFKIKVINKKGKPFNSNGRVFVYTSTESTPRSLDKEGVCTLNVYPSDTVYLSVASYNGIISVNGMDSVVVQVNKNKLYATNPEDEQMTNTGYGLIKRSEMVTPSNSVDAQKVNAASKYLSLAEMLQGRFAGVMVSKVAGGYTVTIRGVNSINSSTEALVVVDGLAYSSFNAANYINVNDIKTIDVIKDGSMYGSRGANGVIVITTRNN